MQRMLIDSELSLPRAQKEVQELFGDEHENDIWAMLNKINDLDPDEFEAGRGEITAQVEEKLHSTIAHELTFARNADVDMGSPSGTPDEEDGQSERDHTDERTMVLDRHSARLKRQLDEQTLLAQWTAQSPDDTINHPEYRIFNIACRVSFLLFLGRIFFDF